MDQIEIVETLDSRTCAVCQPLDGTVVPLSQYEPGVTVPPFHPNCRGTTCPHYEDMDGERAARTADGKVYYVPANMTFSQWKKAFVDGVKDGLTVATAGAIMKKTVDDCTTVDEVEALMKEQGWFYQTTLPNGKPLTETSFFLCKAVILKPPKLFSKPMKMCSTAFLNCGAN